MTTRLLSFSCLKNPLHNYTLSLQINQVNQDFSKRARSAFVNDVTQKSQASDQDFSKRARLTKITKWDTLHIGTALYTKTMVKNRGKPKVDVFELRERGYAAFMSLRKSAKDAGIQDWPFDEINAETNAARREKKAGI